jgi:hypothetical protein
MACWVHGTSVRPEREGYHITKRYAGFGVTFISHGEEWFHFAIPTPIILNNRRNKLKKVFVFFDTLGTTATIKSIHLYDNGHKFKSFDNVNESGQHDQQVDAHNSWQVSPSHDLLGGLCISVLVRFGDVHASKPPAIKFVSGGADLFTFLEE